MEERKVQLLKKVFGQKSSQQRNEKTDEVIVYAPIEGRVIPLNAIPDPVFSEGVLGPGCGIEPSQGIVYAPFDGTVISVADTKHAIGISSIDGVEILIHIGIDTVDMAGEGFEIIVTEGQKIKKGEIAAKFSLNEIKQAGHPSTSPIIITNTKMDKVQQLLAEGYVTKDTELMKVSFD